MKVFVSALLFVLIWSCTQKKQYLKGTTDWQLEMNNKFKDASTSPLTKKGLKQFDGLDFFTFDSTYVVTAHLKRSPDSKWFKMKTTTERESTERVFGVVTFNLGGKEYQLNVYQGAENLETKGFEDYLFLPFLDDTNGNTTYGGGRYIDLRIPQDSIMSIDFNKAYNPYCVYNEKYSCPIVPRANYVSTQIEAGMKTYNKL